MTQQARNVSWELKQLGVVARFLIHDHDDKYGGGSDFVFESDGMAVIRTPIAATRANSHMERQIGSTRGECLDWLLILNRRHLERVLTQWLEHYNQARPHRGLDLRTPIARSDPVVTSGPVTRFPFVPAGFGLGLVGVIVYGIATLRAGVFPRWVGVLLLVGTPLTLVAESVREHLPRLLHNAGHDIFRVSLILFGYAPLAAGDGKDRRVSAGVTHAT